MYFDLLVENKYYKTSSNKNLDYFFYESNRKYFMAYIWWT